MTKNTNEGNLSRRSFLRLGGLAAAGVVIGDQVIVSESQGRPWTSQERLGVESHQRTRERLPEHIFWGDFARGLTLPNGELPRDLLRVNNAGVDFIALANSQEGAPKFGAETLQFAKMYHDAITTYPQSVLWSVYFSDGGNIKAEACNFSQTDSGVKVLSPDDAGDKKIMEEQQRYFRDTVERVNQSEGKHEIGFANMETSKEYDLPLKFERSPLASDFGISDKYAMALSGGRMEATQKFNIMQGFDETLGGYNYLDTTSGLYFYSRSGLYPLFGIELRQQYSRLNNSPEGTLVVTTQKRNLGGDGTVIGTQTVDYDDPDTSREVKSGINFLLTAFGINRQG